MNIDKHNFAEDKHKDCDSNESVSDNSLCRICGSDHNVLVIGLEDSGHIITEHFFKEGPVKIKVNSNVKRKATTLDLINLFWKRAVWGSENNAISATQPHQSVRVGKIR